MATDQRKRTMDALERRFAVAKAELVQQKKHKVTYHEGYGKENNNAASTSLHRADAPKTPSSSLSKKDPDENGLTYSQLPQAVHENLLTTGVKFESKKGSVVDKILHDLFQHGDASQKYMQGSRNIKIDNWILLDNYVPGKSIGSRTTASRSNSKHSRRHMSMKQHKKLGTFNLPQDLHKFDVYKPMHEIWKDYMMQLLKKTGRNELPKYLLSADLHGAAILVADCKIKSFTGISGIMIRETAETFGIITQDNKLKGELFIAPHLNLVYLTLLCPKSCPFLYFKLIAGRSQCSGTNCLQETQACELHTCSFYLRQKIMGNLEVEKARLGFDSKRYTTLLFVCSIALPVSLMIIIMYQNQLFDLTGGLAKAAKSRNVTALNVDSKNDSSPPEIIPDERLHNGNLPPGFGDGSSSENKYLRHTNGTDKQLNGTMATGFWNESGSRNDSIGNATSSKNNSLPNTSGPDEKQLNGTLAPGFRKESGSRNYSENDSLLNTSRPNVKHHNETLAPRFQKESGSRNDSSQSNIMPDDKLLDGLLAPGFDERSCLSRYQSFLYRKTSLHKPSSYLLSKLRRYEDIHKRCGPHSKSYHKALKGLRSSHDSRGGCKYVVWIPANGLGNRMLSMAATFLYALLTNRVLLVNHKTDMANLFCEPFPNTSWLLPNDFPLRNHFRSSKHRYAHSFGRMLNKSITNTSMEPPESYLDLNLALGGYDQLAFCDESQALLQQIPWLILLSDQYFVPSLYMIPSFNQEIRKLFPEKETVFYHLGHYLFHPSNQVWGLITRFYQAYLAKADERIGLQIRVYHDKTTPYQTVMDQILDCVLKEKLLPEVADIQEPTRAPSRNQTSKAILITSLYSEYYENMKNMYWTKPTVTGEVISVYQPSHEEYQHFGDDMHNMKAWADIYLLSLCDVLVTSTWSTFGYVAHGLAGLKPWIWQMPRNKNPACQRAMSMEPCCHFPLSYDCKTRIEVNAATLLPNTMHCEDRKNGLKLVDVHGKLPL
ncbi:hypothetical protein SADUNF_Sadunf01G0027400 [Salix dunnii]|uniref:Fucosyltransferase n=1 Tax=Salix dunnii TaxID=1413687 RepID=A0A835TIV7_9ROSI|nr:hypothetical protein SADUNF_Sadunf01G0027400 [Salix dunnii]